MIYYAVWNEKKKVFTFEEEVKELALKDGETIALIQMPDLEALLNGNEPMTLLDMPNSVYKHFPPQFRLLNQRNFYLDREMRATKGEILVRYVDIDKVIDEGLDES